MKKILLAEETLFKNEEAFSYDYVPEIFSFRESQLRTMAISLKPAMRNRKAANLLLVGNPATGKTTAIRLVFEQISGVYCVHVNSKIYCSPYRIFAEIYRKIFGFLPPETGVSLPTLYEKIFRKLLKERKYLIVALDDIQYLLSDMSRVLYDMLRSSEAYPGTGVSVIAVTDKTIMHRLDDKVRSVFQPTEIVFPNYAREEVYEILKQRCDSGFYSGVIKDQLLRKLSATTFQKNDLRSGIESLRKAAVNAEAEGSREIGERHFVPQENQAPKEETELLSLIPDGGIKSGDLFSLLKEKMGYTKFYRLLQKLEVSNSVKMETIRGVGNTRLIKKR